LRKKSISKWNICFGFSIMDSKTYSYMSWGKTQSTKSLSKHNRHK
jgi:hypothetical protein